MVPFPPGGSDDFIAHLLTGALREILGQPVLVENRAGAGGNVGADSVAKAVPDGLTLRLAAPGPPELRRWRSWWRWAKREPGGLAFGPSGNGRSNHLARKLLKAQAGIDITHASCRGAAPAVTDPVGGQLRGFQLRGGQVQSFEATGATRAEVLPDLPTIAASGVPGFEAEPGSAWWHSPPRRMRR